MPPARTAKSTDTHVGSVRTSQICQEYVKAKISGGAAAPGGIDAVHFVSGGGKALS